MVSFNTTLEDYKRTLELSKKVNESWKKGNILHRTFKLFLLQHLRQSVWDDLFKDHVEEHYPKGHKERGSVTTNLPRDLWKKDQYSWETFIKACQILNRAFDSLDIVVTADIGKTFKWVMPVKDVDLDTKGVKLASAKEFIPKDYKTTTEPPLVIILRDLLKETEITPSELRTRINVLMNGDTSLDKRKISYLQGSLVQTTRRGNITFNSLLTLFKLLEVKSYAITINAVSDSIVYRTTQAARMN